MKGVSDVQGFPCRLKKKLLLLSIAFTSHCTKAFWVHPPRTWSTLTSNFSAPKHRKDMKLLVYIPHCFYRQPGEGIRIGPNWDLSKALNNRYRLLLLRIDRYPGHFGVLLIKIHLLAFVVVAIKWIIRPKTKKNLFS